MAAGDTLRRITANDSWILDAGNNVVGLKNPNASGRDLRFDSQAKLSMRQTRIQLPARLNVRQVMASPPTVTQSATATLATPFPRYVSSANNSFPMGLSLTDWASWPKAPITELNVTTGVLGSYGREMQAFSFIHDGQAFELGHTSNSGEPFLVKVDDQYVTMTPYQVSGTNLFTKFDFGTTKRRRIDFIGYNGAVSFVNFAQTDGVEPAPIRGPRVLVVGDSFTAGSGASGVTANSFTTIMSDLLGWDDIWPSGVGGTGYVNTNGGASVAFGTRLAHDVIPYTPEIVWFVGSTNDDGFPAAQVGAAALSAFQAIAALLPNALIVASPTAAGGVNKLTANKLSTIAAVKAAVQQVGGVWVNPLELPMTASATPQSGFLQAAASAGTAGSTGILCYGTQATGGPPQTGGTIQIGSGATLERIQVKSTTFAGSDAAFNGGTYYFTVTFDGTLQYTHPRLDTWTQVGGSYLTGTGRIGTLSGFGNSDRYVSSDATHPTDAGHWALAENLVSGLYLALAPN